MATDFTWLLECIDTQSPGDITVEVGQATATLFFIIKDKDLQKVLPRHLSANTLLTSAPGLQSL